MTVSLNLREDVAMHPNPLILTEQWRRQSNTEGHPACAPLPPLAGDTEWPCTYLIELRALVDRALVSSSLTGAMQIQ